MEIVEAHFQRVEPFFDEFSVGIVHLTVQSYSNKGSPISELINEKRRV